MVGGWKVENNHYYFVQADKSALGWDHLEKVDKHESQKGNNFNRTVGTYLFYEYCSVVDPFDIDLDPKKIPTFFLKSRIWYSKLWFFVVVISFLFIYIDQKKWFIVKNNIIFLFFWSFFSLPGSIPDPFSQFTIWILHLPNDSAPTESGSTTLENWIFILSSSFKLAVFWIRIILMRIRIRIRTWHLTTEDVVKKL